MAAKTEAGRARKKPAKVLPRRIEVENVGPIGKADVEFGDLTVLVGPQATGKSIFLQILKLVSDRAAIQQELKRFNFDWGSSGDAFLDLFFGEGMHSIWRDTSALKVDGTSQSLKGMGRKVRATAAEKDTSSHKLFYIPAQRVMSLVDGQTRTFMTYRPGDPFVIREFSDQLHRLMQSELIGSGDLFPRSNRLKEPFRDSIEKNIFGKSKLTTDISRSERRIVLSPSDGVSLPYLVWSAGQREFVPLLLGLYWLMPPGATPRRQAVQTVVLEELEMGLHPNAISTLLALVLELLRREYRVVLSTHSPHVLDLMWGLRFIQANKGTERDVLEMLELPSRPDTRLVARAALAAALKVYYFEREGVVRDISGLDPSSKENSESTWGGLTEFSGRVADVVSRLASAEGG